MKLTDLDAGEYLRSLALTEGPTEVHAMDGAGLWRIADDHFVVLILCTEHSHQGPEFLRRVLPPEWGVFHSATNPALGFEARHYGPVDA